MANLYHHQLTGNSKKTYDYVFSFTELFIRDNWEDSLTRSYGNLEYKEKLIPIFNAEFFLKDAREEKDKWTILNDVSANKACYLLAYYLHQHATEYFIKNNVPFVDYFYSSEQLRKLHLYQRVTPRLIKLLASSFKDIKVTSHTIDEYILLNTKNLNFRFGV
jgi:hypothetical protein